MNLNWTTGASMSPSPDAELWTATIDVKDHGAAIAVYARTEEEATRRRNFILGSCIDAARKGALLDDSQLLHAAADHGFGRMVAQEKKRRTAPPPPDIFVGAWENFLALARAIPTIYRDRLLGLRDGLREALGIEGGPSDEELVEAVKRLKAGHSPSTDPTVEQVLAFKVAFHDCHQKNLAYNESVRLALKAALKGGAV